MAPVTTRDHTALADRSPAELAAFLTDRQAAYARLCDLGLTLDLTRGKPSAEQLDLSNGLLALPTRTVDATGADIRNYGGLAGLPELRSIFAELLGVPTQQLLAAGNSSLEVMHQVLVHLRLHGRAGSPRPWAQEDRVAFVCPVPGYDRHFTMLAHHGIEMIPVPMTADGPDPDAVAAAVGADPAVKGMWVVPTYANPTGAVCTQEVAAALAAMPTAAPDFTIFWDNAYAVHHLGTEEAKSADLLSLCAASGNPDRAFLFASTSKVTYAGAGVAFVGSSPANIAWYLDHQQYATIGPDKVNQLRHAELLGSAQGVRDHMARHREILAPKFAAVLDALHTELDGLGIATWTSPTGGYFVNLDVLDGTASRVVALAKAAGIALTPAGSAFPHGHDPDDRNIRLAPTFPSLEDVRTAMAGVATCVALAAAERLTGAR